MIEPKQKAGSQYHKRLRRSPLAAFYYGLASSLLMIGLLVSLADLDGTAGIPLMALGVPFVVLTFRQQRRDERMQVERDGRQG